MKVAGLLALGLVLFAALHWSPAGSKIIDRDRDS